MKPQDLTRWNARVSLLYAVGIWTMFGTYAYYQMYVWPRKKDEPQNTNGNYQFFATIEFWECTVL